VVEEIDDTKVCSTKRREEISSHDLHQQVKGCTTKLEEGLDLPMHYCSRLE
jgi:hypothetical protein